jgi:trehalose transport system substrate-binding protein
MAQAFRARRGAPKVTLALAEGAPTAITVAELVLGFGGDPLVLNDAGSVAAFELLAGLWRDGLLARESLVAKYDTQVDHLISDGVARAELASPGVLARQDLLDRFEVYEGWRGPVRAAHVVGGDVLGIPRGVSGRRRELAVRLAQYLMSRDAQERLVAGNAWPAIRQDAYGRVPEVQRQTFEAVRRALADGWLRPGVAYWPAVSDAMNEAVRRSSSEASPRGPSWIVCTPASPIPRSGPARPIRRRAEKTTPAGRSTRRARVSDRGSGYFFEASKISPNSTQRSPSNFASCSCSIG